MAFLKKIGNFFKNLQKQPEHIRKIILWSVVIFVGLAFLFFWFHDMKIRLNNFQKQKFLESIGVSQLQNQLEQTPEIKMPELETPQINEEDLKKMEEAVKEMESSGTESTGAQP